MLLKISHRTQYHFDRPVAYALQRLRKTPKSRAGQTVRSWDISIKGGQKQAAYEDHHNNKVDLISIDANDREISIEARGEVETSDNKGIVGLHGGFAPLWMFLRSTSLTRPGPGVRKLAKAIDPENSVASLHELSHKISAAVGYEKDVTDASTTAEDAVQQGAGVCQDHAHIFIAACRSRGIPSRYASGYLMMPDVADQAASHAWAEAYVDGLGWVGFDVSNGIAPDEKYVRVATGLDYSEAAPISGIRYGVQGETMLVSLQVEQ